MSWNAIPAPPVYIILPDIRHRNRIDFALLMSNCAGECWGQFGYRKLLYYKDFPGMSKPVFMVSVCSSVKIKGRDCGTINGHDESSSIRALMKDAREVLVR